MYVVLGSQKLQSARNLFSEMPHDDLVQPTNSRIRVFLDHSLSLRVIGQVGPFFNKCGEISEFAELHYDMHFRRCFLAVDKGNNVGVV